VSELTCQAWRERPLYWSTIGHVRVWWATDGVRLAIIRRHGMHEAEFGGLFAGMQAVMKRGLLPRLPSARILDTLLMARGGRGGDAGAIERLNAFLALLPATTRNPLEALAQDLQTRFGGHPLASPDKPVVPRRKKARS
jgi:hypothetical protein